MFVYNVKVFRNIKIIFQMLIILVYRMMNLVTFLVKTETVEKRIFGKIMTIV